MFVSVQSISGADAFFIYLANLFMALMVAESLMIALSALSKEFMVGLILGAGIMCIYGLNCGFFLIPSKIPDGWYWIHKGLSFHTYNFIIFMKNEFEDFNEGAIDGNAVLKVYDMDDIEISTCFAILVGMMIVYRVIFYILLRFLNRRQN